jgi:protein-S-isoprenylcysteine O-methyltransferase Ste14
MQGGTAGHPSEGFLLQWPTLRTVAMFPVLIAMYVRLARQEEAEAMGEFGSAYREYASRTPAFVPRLSSGPVTGTPASGR